jgi:orotate phosphoribosyltransferase
MKTTKQRLLELLRERSFRAGEFTLASGKKSDFFIDCKRTVLTPEGLSLAGAAILEAIEAAPETSQGVGAIAAVPLGGCPLADSAALQAFQRGCPTGVLYVRPERKDHGTAQKIEGSQCVAPGARVVLVEDVVTTGGSSLRAVEALSDAGYELLFLVALVDRLEGGAEHLAEAGVELRPLFTRHDFIAPVG